LAHLTPLWTQDATGDPHEIAGFLAERDIVYERWELPERVTLLAAQSRLTDAEKEELLSAFRGHLDRLASDAGYVDADVIAIRADLDGIDGALAKFDKVHFHDDDEVRAIVGGSGVFGFIGDDGRQFLLKVEAGDYISVPRGMWHWFYCHSSKNITALRLFKDREGWTPHYRSTDRGTPGS
jgi:1,2-dihydroxy-3-keto-5-methylthiopentene dioxygenase